MKPLHILICDDDKVGRHLLQIMLKRMKNVEADFAENGAEGLEKFIRNSNYDLIITDLDMPDISGEELIKIVREDFNSDIPIMIATGSYLGDVQALVAQYNVNDVLIKPYKPIELRASILEHTSQEYAFVSC